MSLSQLFIQDSNTSSSFPLKKKTNQNVLRFAKRPKSLVESQRSLYEASNSSNAKLSEAIHDFFSPNEKSEQFDVNVKL